MVRRLLLLVTTLLACRGALAASCSLEMTVNCDDNQCTSTTVNTGSGSCAGVVYSGWFVTGADASVSLSTPDNSLNLDTCFGSGDFGQETPSPFAFCFGDATLHANQSFTSTVHVSGANATRVPLLAMTWIGDPQTDEEIGSAYAFANVVELTCTPSIGAPPIAQHDANYTVSWTPVSDPNAAYIIDESTSPDFTANLVSSTVQGVSRTFNHAAQTTTTYYYRVRATQCGGGTPSYSGTAQTVVQGQPPVQHGSADAAVPFGSTTPVEMKVFIPGSNGSGKTALDTTFNATTDKPYLTVTPSSGTLPPQGTTVTVTANPTQLPPGANTGTLKVASNGTTTNIPVSVSLVTPVTPGGKTIPPLNALIIPVVTHVNGAAGPFLSDVRLTNAGAASIQYQITMTPTQSDATTSSKVTNVTVEPQKTIALNDIAKNFFGYGATGGANDVGFGSLEIRPLNTSSLMTFASSRTYASTALGTFGQFIGAVPFARFATLMTSGIPIPGSGVPPSNKLSIQQVAQSAKFRTNLGIVEGAGLPATGHIRIFDLSGTQLKDVAFSLLPGEHRQMNRFIETSGIANLEDGRIEIEVDSPTGAVTAYASVLDNVTTDPLAVMPVDVSKISARRYVLPGMADLPGENNFHSDIRVFNGGTSDVTATFTYYPQGGGAPANATPRTIHAGEVLAIDNVLPTLFDRTSTGGSIVITTPNDSSLVATGRTYTNVAGGGTYGQFIPGVMPTEGVGLGDRALEVLQLEQSDRFRSNLGLAELTGNEVVVRLQLDLPDSIATPTVNVHLNPNEFTQLGRVIESLNPGQQSYNGRITVSVISGSGRVTAYGSVIDNQSKDPTYVPAQ